MHFQNNWVYTIGIYVLGYYLLILLVSLIPNLGTIFYPKHRQIWDGRDFVWIEDPEYSKRYGFIELIKNFIFIALGVIIVVALSITLLPQYISTIVILAAVVFVLMQTLIFPLLKDLLAIVSRRRILQVSEKVQTITYRTIIVSAVALIIVLQFAYPPYTKSKMDVVAAFNKKTPYYTQELLKAAEVAYDYSHAATECDVTYVGKMNMNNMFLDIETRAKLTFDPIDVVWELKSTPHHTLLSDITVQKENPAVFTDTQEISIDGFEGEGIVTVKLISVENGIGSGTLEIYTSDNKKLLYSSNFTIEEAPLLNVDVGYRATMEKPLDVGYWSNASMDISIDISKNIFTFYGWTFAL